MSELPSSPERRLDHTPHLELTEGKDFWDGAELYARITEEIEKLGKDSEAIVLSGHNGRQRERSSFFGFTPDQLRRNIEQGDEWEPHDYAFHTTETESVGQPTITVYDANLLVVNVESYMEYGPCPGRTLREAIILEVALRFPVQ